MNEVLKNKNVKVDKFTYMVGLAVRLIVIETKRRGSDPVLWQKPLHQEKCQKGKVTTQTTPQKVRLNSNYGPTLDGQLE